MHCKNFFIGVNLKKDTNLNLTKKMIDLFKDYPIKLFFEKRIYNLLNRNDILVYKKNKYEMDYVLTLGGDGTFLSYAKKFKNKNIPIIGINLGRIGYLTQIQPNELKNKIDLILQNRFTIIHRILLKYKNYIAINEICIYRGASLKMLKIKLYINDVFTKEFYADGIIIATPTGSSAYNYSAGGTILNAEENRFIITAICPNQLEFQSQIVDDKSKIKIILIPNQTRIKPTMIIDGKNAFKIPYNQEIIIDKADSTLKTIKFNK